MQRPINVLQVLNEFKPNEDGTYDLLTFQQVEYKDGYQVSFVRPEAFLQLNASEWDKLTSYCCDFFQSKAHIGVFDGEAEVSFHSYDLSKSKLIMYEFNQHSILNWETKESFPEDYERWLIINEKYDQKREVNYHEILERI